MIKSALDALNNDYHRPKDSYGVDYKYLFNQSIRQYVVPESNLYVTVDAYNLWKALGIKENIAIKLSSNRISHHDYNRLDAIGIFNNIIQDNNVNYPLIRSLTDQN